MTTGKFYLMMAGGTGGHIYPGLAVAHELQARGARVEWLGTPSGLEATLVPEAGIRLHTINVRGLRGAGWMRWLRAPFVVTKALTQALLIIRKLRPNAVLGMGGFASGPGGVAAWLLRRPLVIHEQNARAGLTNRVLSRFARRVLEAFPGSFKGLIQVHCTGNPVRADIAEVEPVSVPATGVLNVLVLGGSQGARFLNDSVPLALSSLSAETHLEITHQCGNAHLDSTQARYAEHEVVAQVIPFIDDMASAFARAHLVIARAGAMTVTELSNSGRASVLVPFPYAVDDHQRANAQHLERIGAARIITQTVPYTEDVEALVNCLQALFEDRAELTHMGLAAHQLRQPHATAEVADQLVEVAL